MAEGEPPEGWRNRLSRFLRHFAPAKLKETKIRGGAKKGNKREDGEGSSDKSGSSPPERTLDSSSPPLVPAHSSAAELVIAANETRKGAKKRHRRRRTKKAQVEPSLDLHPDGVMIEPRTVFVAVDAPAPVAPADHERTLDVPAPVVVADTDTQVWQDPPKKGHGGPRTDPAAQGMALEPTIVEHSALNPTIAKQERDPKASPFYIIPTPNDDPMVGAVFPVASNEWEKPKKPRARWAPIPPPPRLAPPTPPRHASPPDRSSRHRVAAHQGDETEEEESDDDDEFGIKIMFELKGQEVAHEEGANEREEEEVLHLNYWIKNKELKSKGRTLCLICFLERKRKVAPIENQEDEVNKHLKEAHGIKRGHKCQRKGCWVTGRNKGEIGMHQILCHNM